MSKISIVDTPKSYQGKKMVKQTTATMESQTFNNQLKKTFWAFKAAPKTMKMVAVETGIDRPNVCRYVAWLRKRNKIIVVKKDTCPITRHSAQFFSADPELIPKPGQSSLFPNERPVV